LSSLASPPSASPLSLHDALPISRFDARRSVSSDVENVLRQATYIDDFVRRNSVPYRVANDWTALKSDLNQLASAYNVAWNWDVRDRKSTRLNPSHSQISYAVFCL